MTISDKLGGDSRCGGCGKFVLRTRDFEHRCEEAGFIKDEATGQFKMRVGGLAGTSDSVFSRLGQQQQSQQSLYDKIESDRGYRCKACGTVYCMDCLMSRAPAHPSRGKACPKCGSTFQHFE